MNKTFLGIVVVGVCVCLVAPLYAAPNTISKINVKGNQRLSRAAVLSNVKARVGTAFDEKTVKTDRDRLMDTGRFSQVEATKENTKSGVIVTFIVTERPVLADIQIEGSKAFTAAELLNELPIAQGDPRNKARVQAAKQAIITKYQNDGYYFATVTVDEEQLAAKNKLLLKITEGPKTIITKVKFDGNHYFGNFSLKMKTNTKAKWLMFISGALNMEKIDRDVTLLRNTYTQEGFLDVDVDRELKFSDDKTKVVVTFIIKEGPRYRINKIIIQGNTVFKGDDLVNRLQFHPGSFFTGEVLRFDQKRIEAAYGEVGYIEARVEAKQQFLSPTAVLPDWAKDLDGGQPALLNMIFVVTENDQYRIGEVRIQGNDVTQERVIRRVCTYYPEQLYDTVAVQNSENRLKDTKLFGSVNITPVKTPRQGYKDILVQVTEGETADVMMGISASSNSGLFGNISIKQRNFDILAWPGSWKDLTKPQTFKGAGQTFSMSAEPGTEIMRFTVGWYTPYIFDLPYSLGIKGFVYNREYEHYDATRLGVQGSFGHTFKNRWYGEISTRFENVNMSVGKSADVEIWDDRGVHTLLGFRGLLVRDRTDSRWMPSRGDRFDFSYEQVLGTSTFGKFNVNYKYYKTLYVDSLDRKHILAARGSFGQIVGDAPVFEKFYGGGLGSIRGFSYRGIGPRGHVRGSGAKGDDPIGGDMMLFLGTEYSFPLVGEKLRGVVFLDSGTVESDFGITDYRVSAGVGIRVTIPFMGPVPLALDFGFPLVKSSDDDTQMFSFAIGWTF
ncbi:MAG: outer membrane protein assembly factor BamA [Phycisphaerae bacterium]|nr:outer membrane protein assembly factor BamA [Phycisphaerae bacterium]